MAVLHIDESGAGLPIIWIHGFPLSSLIFRHQLRIEGVRHVTLDLPGFGATSAQPLDTIEQYADAVLDALESLRIDRAILAGVSMGGYVIFSMIRRQPALATGLILIDTREGEDTTEGRAGRHAQIAQVGREGTSGLIAGMLPKMLTESTLLAGDSRADTVRRAMESASVEGVQSALRAMASRPDSTEVLREVRCPVLIAVGSDDQLTPPADAHRMASLITSRVRVAEIRDAAHLSNLERPEEFNAAVMEFLEDLS